LTESFADGGGGQLVLGLRQGLRVTQNQRELSNLMLIIEGSENLSLHPPGKALSRALSRALPELLSSGSRV